MSKPPILTIYVVVLTGPPSTIREKLFKECNGKLQVATRLTCASCSQFWICKHHKVHQRSVQMWIPQSSPPLGEKNDEKRPSELPSPWSFAHAFLLARTPPSDRTSATAESVGAARPRTPGPGSAAASLGSLSL